MTIAHFAKLRHGIFVRRLIFQLFGTELHTRNLLGLGIANLDSPGRALDIGDWGSRREADWRLEISPGRLEIGGWAPGGFLIRGAESRTAGADSARNS